MLRKHSFEFLCEKFFRLMSQNGAITDPTELATEWYYIDRKSFNFYPQVPLDYEGHAYWDAICLSPSCHNLTCDLDDRQDGLCERCGQNSVATSCILSNALNKRDHVYDVCVGLMNYRVPIKCSPA